MAVSNNTITLRIADLCIEVKYRHEETREFLMEYETPDAAHFSVEVTDDDLAYEATLAEEGLEEVYLERAAIYRKIADKITEDTAAVFHGAVLDIDGGAYVIAARSGVGKTTHIRLWLEKYADSVSVLNGDKPIIREIDGVLNVCATPYKGKEGYGKRGNLPLRAIAFLERGEENSYLRITSSEALTRFMAQIYINGEDPLAVARTLRLANKILSDVPLYEFRCNMDLSAAEMARDAFLGNGAK